jgi:hypothetical protein
MTKGPRFTLSIPRVFISLLHLFVVLPLLFQAGTALSLILFLLIAFLFSPFAEGIVLGVIGITALVCFYVFLRICFRFGFSFAKSTYFPENTDSSKGVFYPSENFFSRYLGVVIAFAYMLIIVFAGMVLCGDDRHSQLSSFNDIFVFSHFNSFFGVYFVISFLDGLSGFMKGGVGSLDLEMSPLFFALLPSSIYLSYLAGMARCFRVNYVLPAELREKSLLAIALITAATLLVFRFN